MVQRHFVFFFDFVARVGEQLCEIAIVGQQKHPFGLGVESADIEKPWQVERQKVEDRITRLRIAARRNEPGRLMQHDIEPALTADEFAADFNVVALRRLHAEVGADAAVDRNAACADQFIAMTARTEPGRSEETVQAHWKNVNRD